MTKKKFQKIPHPKAFGAIDLTEEQALEETSQEAVNYMKENPYRIWKEGGQWYVYLGKDEQK